VPTHKGLGPDNCENLQNCRKPAIELDKEPAIMVREPDATMQSAPQDNQLMSKHRVLSLEPHLRLERRGHGGQDETEKSDHSASLGNFITPSTRTGFSVHTTVTGTCYVVARRLKGRCHFAHEEVGSIEREPPYVRH
jgi:hypothetical protein